MMENEIKKQTLAVAVAMAIAAMTYGEAAAPADELARARQKETVIVPEAPEGYRRPKDWRPVLYPKSLREISRDHSAEIPFALKIVR